MRRHDSHEAPPSRAEFRWRHRTGSPCKIAGASWHGACSSIDPGSGKQKCYRRVVVAEKIRRQIEWSIADLVSVADLYTELLSTTRRRSSPMARETQFSPIHEATIKVRTTTNPGLPTLAVKRSTVFWSGLAR